MSTPRDPESTRKRLIEAAFSEIHENGFQGMRVDEVLRQAGLRKGALYHHFGSKTELGYAVLEQVLRPMVEETWIEPIRGAEDPVAALKAQVVAVTEAIGPETLKLGCPLNNLAQEMSPIDEGFRRRVSDLYEYWVEGFRVALEHGQQTGRVRASIDADSAARFLVSILEGCIGLAKARQSKDHLVACQNQLDIYLDALRPSAKVG